MTKRKNVVSKMLLLVLILTLISCCFLGSTFARYTSDGRGTGTLQVAKWDVTITGAATGESELVFGQLSPAAEEYVSENRSHSTGRIAIATITNASDVQAEVTFTATELVFKKADTEITYSPYEKSVLQDVITIRFYDVDSGGTALELQGGEYTTTLDKTVSITIYAEIIWTSDLESDVNKGTDGDARDTWIGQNVETVTCEFTYKAVQATQIPA